MGSPLTVAKAYLEAFANRNVDALPGFFAEKFRFDGPMMQFDSAAAFTGMLREMAQVWTCDHKISREIEAGNEAVLAYDLVMTAPIAQTVAMVEWVRVEDGKITDIKLMFDTAKMAMPGEGA
jgi:predicted SnoaL-like aldol condensation-catalyzing enzyme